MKLVTLKNGRRATPLSVKGIMLCLHRLEEKNPNAFYEIVMKCQYQHHSLHNRHKKVFQEEFFFSVDDDYRTINPFLREVTLCATHNTGTVPNLGAPCKRAGGITIKAEDADRLNDAYLYGIVRQIADLIVKIANKYGCSFKDDRKREPNPFSSQTQSGLFIEHAYCKSCPCKLWTPWGCWEFIGPDGGTWDKVWEEVAKCFGATLYIQKINRSSELVPVFAITKFGRKRLPKPVERTRESFDYIYDDVFEAAKAVWNKLSGDYVVATPRLPLRSLFRL